MADTFTTNLRLRKPQINANNNAWAALLNEMVSDVDQSIAGFFAAVVTAGNVVLSSSNGIDDQARRMIIYATGTQAVTNRTVTVPDTNKLYLFVNDSAQQVTFTRVSGGTTLVVRAGQSCLAFVTAAGIFEVPPLGTPVQDVAGLTTLTLDIGGAHGAGDATTTMKYVVQGGWVWARINAFSPNNFSVAGFTLDRTGGIDWPAELVPANKSQITVMATENAANMPAYLEITTAGATPWNILKASGAAWLGTGTDDRTLQAIAFTYPLKGP